MNAGWQNVTVHAITETRVVSAIWSHASIRRKQRILDLPAGRNTNAIPIEWSILFPRLKSFGTEITGMRETKS
jgi:hypothetical protein